MINVLSKVKPPNSSTNFVICRGNCQIQDVSGDLFQSSESLAHCVSQDFAMGAGTGVV